MSRRLFCSGPFGHPKVNCKCPRSMGFSGRIKNRFADMLQNFNIPKIIPSINVLAAPTEAVLLMN